MPKTQKDIEKYLIDLYDSVIKNGKTHDEALENVSIICKELTNQEVYSSLETIMRDSSSNYNHFINEEIKSQNFKYYHIQQTSLDLSIYKDALLKALGRWQKKAEKSILPTNQSAKEIITKFSNVILENGSEKIVFEPAIGTATLLLNINYNQLIGFDVNSRLVQFANNLLELNNIKNKYITKNNSLNKPLTIQDITQIDVKFSAKNSSQEQSNNIDKENIWNNKGLFIFDPPIGEKNSKSSVLKSKTAEILDNSTEDDLLSEVNFLLNFLIYAKNDSYCLCKMPISFLTSRQRDLDALRKYLINNSLIAVIRDSDNFVILLLKQTKHITSTPFYAINYDSNLSEEIIRKIILQEDFSNALNSNINITTRETIINKTAGNIITLPSLMLDLKEYEKPVYYFNQIVNRETEIKSQLITIGNKLIENKLISLSEKKDTELKELLSNYYSINPIIEQNQDNTQEQILAEESQNISNNKYWFDDDTEINKDLKTSFQKIVPEYINKKNEIYNLDPYSIEIKEYFNYLSILYQNEYLKNDNGKLILSLKKDEKFQNLNDYEEEIMPKNYSSNNIVYNINTSLKLISEKQKIFYINLCKYWFNYQCNSNKDLFEEYSYAYITRTLKMFETLGLAVCINQEQSVTNYYDKFRPYHPLVDEFEFEVI